MLVFLLLLLPSTAFAHVKWFVPTGQSLAPTYPAFTLTEPAVLLWLLLALIMVGASQWLDRRLPTTGQPGLLGIVVTSLLPYGTGISLLLTAWSGAVLAPHFQWEGPSATALLLLEALAGALLLFPPLVFMGAITLLTVYGCLLLRFALPDVLEYVNLLGIAVFLACTHHPSAEHRRVSAPSALAILRISTGLALLTLAFTEKLLRPDYAETFVQTYMWNFMQNLGVETYTDRLFVLSAGAMEAALGLLLILGSTTRLTILVVSGFMLTSNLTFLFQGETDEALLEITGHLPIICTALILLVFGNQKGVAPRAAKQLDTDVAP